MAIQSTKSIEFKDYATETSLLRSRLFFLILLLLLLFLALITRIWYLQVYSYQHFDVLSKDNRVRLLPLAPIRGQIVDRKNKVVAENTPIFNLEILPSKIKNMTKTLDRVSQIIAISPRELRKFKQKLPFQPKFEPLVLKFHLSEPEIARFVVNQHKFTGVKIQAALQRYYPYEGELAHVLGYVGRINKAEKKKIDASAYKGTTYIGKLGIEAKYENLLLGQVGFEQVEHNAHGQKIRVLQRKSAVPGQDLKLHIDVDLQISARKLLGNHRGSVVAIEPSTGAVLAFVSNPIYDQNKFVNGIDHFSYNALRDNINKPLLNRALNGRYAPGSTIKGLVALAALENGWNKEKILHCKGYYQLKGSSHRYRCWKRPGHGNLTMSQAIMQSCDVYFYQLAKFLKIEKLSKFFVDMGLGKKTQIDLLSEPTGLIPSAKWKKRVKEQPWYPGETLITGIGQGYMLVTPIQLGVLAATIANKGKIVSAKLVQGTNTIEQDRPAISTLFKQHFESIALAMKGVVHDQQYGSARALAKNLSYEMAGKSGTAQVVAIAQGAKYDENKLTDFEKDHALFIAFAPYDKPEIAVAVIVENGGSGSKVAAPIAKGVLDAYLTPLTKNKDANDKTALR